jgi:predicted aldo/keto reductase-like oxidoreductase
MKYRRFGKLDWEVTILGFDAMRLSLIDENPIHFNAVSVRMPVLRKNCCNGLAQNSTSATC